MYAVLEGAFEIVVANAQPVKKVPGRKTDVKDAEWLADLLCHGQCERSHFILDTPHLVVAVYMSMLILKLPAHES